MDTKRIEGLEFHVESQDYFGTLATVLSLDMQNGQPPKQEVINDLMYLQENYKLVIK